MQDLIARPIKRNYTAIYAVESFERKTIPSYALWAVVVKDPSAGRYPKTPTGYGKTETLEQAHHALTDWCLAHDLRFEEMRADTIPWRLVKDLLKGKSGAEYQARQIKRARASNTVLDIPRADQSLVYADKGLIFTDTLKVAERFEKQHKNVLQAYDGLPKDEFSRLNFQPSDYVDERGKPQRLVRMTWKGFSMLAMGFTGKKAYVWKQQFLDAFEMMGQEIHRRRETVSQLHTKVAWQQARLEGKDARRHETDAIAAFVEYATAQGSRNACHYYANVTKMTHQALFLVEQGLKLPNHLRDLLNGMQLSFLTTAEYVCANAIREGMQRELPYKDIYALARDKVTAFAASVGKTPALPKQDQAA